MERDRRDITRNVMPRDPSVARRIDDVVHTHLVESLARNLQARRVAEDPRKLKEARREGIILVSMALGRGLNPYELMHEARELLKHEREV